MQTVELWQENYPEWSKVVAATGAWKIETVNTGSPILYLEVESASKWLRWTGLTRRWVHEYNLNIDCTTTHVNRRGS